jgi:hypothetical protein
MKERRASLHRFQNRIFAIRVKSGRTRRACAAISRADLRCGGTSTQNGLQNYVAGAIDEVRELIIMANRDFVKQQAGFWSQVPVPNVTKNRWFSGSTKELIVLPLFVVTIAPQRTLLQSLLDHRVFNALLHHPTPLPPRHLVVFRVFVGVRFASGGSLLHCRFIGVRLCGSSPRKECRSADEGRGHQPL